MKLVHQQNKRTNQYNNKKEVVHPPTTEENVEVNIAEEENTVEEVETEIMKTVVKEKKVKKDNQENQERTEVEEVVVEENTIVTLELVDQPMKKRKEMLVKPTGELLKMKSLESKKVLLKNQLKKLNPEKLLLIITLKVLHQKLNQKPLLNQNQRNSH